MHYPFLYHRLRPVLALLIGLAGIGSVWAQDSASDSLLAAYVQEAWTTHPEIEQMRAMVEAERGRTTMSRAWMNPELRVGLMDVPTSFDTHMDPATMWQIGLMQRVPFPGKLRAAGRAGAARTAAAEAGIDVARYELASMVIMAYYDLSGALRTRQILERGRDLNRQMVDATAVMISGGMGSQTDVLQANNELVQWNVRLVENTADINRKRAALAYALGREDTTGLPDPILPDSLPPSPDMRVASATSGLENSPELRRLRLEADAASLEARRARLDYWPDLDVMVSYGLRGYLRTMEADPHTGAMRTQRVDQDPMVSIEISAPMPLFFRGNQQARIREMTAMQRASESALQKARLAKEQELRDLMAEWQRAVDCCNIAQANLLPQVEDGWRAALTDYRSGRTNYMNLAQARMNVVMTLMELTMDRADAWVAYQQFYATLGLLNTGKGD